MTMPDSLLLSPLIAPVLGVSLTLLILSLTLWRLRRRRLRFAQMIPEPDPAISAPARDLSAPEIGEGRAFARALRGPDPEIWRPPARETLLRRQQQQERQRAGREVPSRRLSQARRRASGNGLSGHAAQVLSQLQGAAIADAHLTLIQEAPLADPARSSRLGRKRQGLDSLITELPRKPEEPTGER